MKFELDSSVLDGSATGFLEDFMAKVVEMVGKIVDFEVKAHNRRVDLELDDLNEIYLRPTTCEEMEEIKRKKKEIEDKRWGMKEKIEFFKAQLDSLGIKINPSDVSERGERGE